VSKRISDKRTSIQLDESTDISKMAQLLLFVRYIYEGSIHENILFCCTLEGNTRGKDIYIYIYTYII